MEKDITAATDSKGYLISQTPGIPVSGYHQKDIYGYMEHTINTCNEL